MLTKIFQSGGSQAVRIPKNFRFEGDTVEIFRAENGDVVLRAPQTSQRGDELFAILAQFDDDFIAQIETRDNEPPQERDAL